MYVYIYGIMVEWATVIATERSNVCTTLYVMSYGTSRQSQKSSVYFLESLSGEASEHTHTALSCYMYS